MDLTEEQRRRMEENRAKAQARLREKRARQSPAAGSAVEGGRREAAEPGRTGIAVAAAVAAAGQEADVRLRGDGEPSSAAHRVNPGPNDQRERNPAAGSPAAGPGRAGGASSSRSSSTTSTRAGGGGRGGSARGGDGGAGGGGADAAAAAAAAAGVAAGACEGCAGAEGDDRVDKELLEGFGITVCRACKLKNEDFRCVTKKEAKETYLLPEGTIAVLKFIERDNPRHSSWTKMKLYLRRDVAAYSYKRWGSEDGLAEERNRRDSLKFDRSLSRTKGVFKRLRAETEEEEGGVL